MMRQKIHSLFSRQRKETDTSQAHNTKTSGFIRSPFCLFLAKVLIFLMVFQGLPLWELSQSYEWNPNKFSKTLSQFINIINFKQADAGQVTVFGPKKYIRTTGKPNIYQDTFFSEEGKSWLTITNGEEDGSYRLSSAVITLNGKEIIGVNDFNQTVYRLRVAVDLLSMNNLIVELRSNPQHYLQIEITASSENQPPVADAGPDQTVRVTETVTLDGSGSSDVDGDPLTYQWSFISRPAGSTAALSDPGAVGPTFDIDLPGTYEVQLIVNDGRTDSIPDTVIITTENSPPVANAGPDQTVFVTETVTLDGSGSSDVDGDPLTYYWSLISIPESSTAALFDPSAVNPTFYADKPGSYVAQLIVNDGMADSAPDTVTITTENSPPVADAGPDQSVLVGTTVTLDGSGSTDIDGDALSFLWSLTTKPLGSLAVLSDYMAIKPIFLVDKPGSYVAQLIVNDGMADSAPDTVTITTENSPPVADAGPDQTVFVTETVTLDGSGSSDIDGDLLTFQWSFTSKPMGSMATLSDTAAVMPNFIVDVPGTYALQLIVNDGTVSSAPDTVTIITENSPPVADAGPDQSVLVTDTVILDGSGSSDVDGDPLTYQWSMLSKPAESAAVLSDPSISSPTFFVDKFGIYLIQLIVNDGLVDSAPDTVTITTANSPPVADAGADQEVTIGETVTLDGSGSSDVDGDPLTYLWSFTSKPVGSLSSIADPLAETTSFVPDLEGMYVTQLIVNDGTVNSSPDTATTTASPLPNSAPEAVNDAYSVDEDTMLVSPSSVLSNDSDPDGDPLTAILVTDVSNGTLSLSGNGTFTYTPDENFHGTDGFTYKANDGLLDSNTAAVTITVNPMNDAPVAVAGDPQTVDVGMPVTLNGSGSYDVDGDILTYAWEFVSKPATSLAILLNADTVSPSFTPDVEGKYDVQLIVHDGTVNSLPSSVNITGGGQLPPDPSDVAPPNDPTVATTVYSSTEFIYTGDNPIQTGVEPGTIEMKRAAVIRGKVLDKENNPLPGVTITILNHPEFGQTLSRADGMFDMAVNGGGYLNVKYEKNGYLPAQRQVDVPWQDWTWAPDVVLIQLDEAVSSVDLTQPGMQVAQGRIVTDAKGTRQSTLLFPEGTQATMVMPDGSTQPISNLNVRVTEYSVGENGPDAMPAELPPGIGYTYCAELSADEALAAGATQVIFDQPVVNYIEDFIGFPAGSQIPFFYYDHSKGLWIPEPNGTIIDILGITGGLADLDTDGDGMTDDSVRLSSLGITDAERERIGSLYTIGQKLMRVQLDHFTPYDCNYIYDYPASFYPDAPEVQTEEPSPLECGSDLPSSSIVCQNQTLGESIPVVGTPFTLNYDSSRTPGRITSRYIRISVPGTSCSYTSIWISIAGRKFFWMLPCTPEDRNYEFTWDGMDAYGREVYGELPVSVRFDYWYPMLRCSGYWNELLEEWIEHCSVIEDSYDVLQGAASRTILKNAKNPLQSIGGWTLNVNHSYSSFSRILYRGDGSTVTAQNMPKVITKYAGDSENCAMWVTDPKPTEILASEICLEYPRSLKAGPDGSLYVGTYGSDLGSTIWKVGTDGIAHLFAGIIGTSDGHSGDGGPATEAEIGSPEDIDIGPDGSVYFISMFWNTIDSDYECRIRKVSVDGIITTVAGSGLCGFNGDGGPALEAQLEAESLAVGRDGSIYIGGASRVRRVTMDGIIDTIWIDEDWLPWQEPKHVYDIAVTPEGSFYIAYDENYVFKVGPDGDTTTYAGPGEYLYDCILADGDLATNACISNAISLALSSDGGLYIGQDNGYDVLVRYVDTEGIIRTVAGNKNGVPFEENIPATALKIEWIEHIALAPDGTIFIIDNGGNVMRVAPALQGLSLSDNVIPSTSGSELYVFNYLGKHLRTLNTLTGATKYEFAYDSQGFLASIADGNGNVTTIERDVSGNPTAIVGPYVQRTTVTLDANGYLASINNPADEAWHFSYTAGGLLTAGQNPNEDTSTYNYDGFGNLIQTNDPAGGLQTLSRTGFKSGYEVSRTTALSRTTTYRVERLTTGHTRLTNTFPNGLPTEVLIGTDGSQTTTFPDGNIISQVFGPDPRFGMQSPITESLSFSTPGGLNQTMTTSSTVSLADPSDPLSLVSKTDTMSINGKTFTSSFDSTTSQITMTTPVGRQVVETVDTLGRIVSKEVSGISPMFYTYDGQGRLTNMIFGTGDTARTYAFTYNANGFISSITDPLLRVAALEYDGAGRVTRQTTPDGHEILFTYDSNGNMSSITPPGRPAHIFTYTPVNLMDEYAPPDAGAGTNSTVYSFNADRQMTQISRPDGLLVGLDYDAAGRLHLLATDRGITTYSYNPSNGHLLNMSTPEGDTFSLTYDGSFITGCEWGGVITGTISQAYNNEFRVMSRSINGGNTIAFTYDNDGLLTGAGTLSLTRDANNGRVTGSTLGNVTDTMTYNEFSEIKDYSAAFSGTPQFSEAYTRDKLGRITLRTETVEGVTHTYEYLYDFAGRLNEVKRDGIVISTYTYDPNGNRMSHNAATGTYDDQDRLTQYGDFEYTYTANGELKTKTNIISSQTTTFNYDAFGNLMGVTLPDGTVIEYVIDGVNRRIGKKVNGTLVQGFLYKDSLKPIAELDGSNTVISRFIYGSKMNVPDYMVKGGNTYRIISDRLGSPRMVINTSTGVIEQQMEYDEFGNVISNTNPGVQPFGFAGGLYDTDTHLTRFGARDYDAFSGRWTTKDPILFAGISSNLYAYSFDDPVNVIDPDGKLIGVLIVGIAALAIFGLALNLAESAQNTIDNFQNTNSAIEAAANADLDTQGSIELLNYSQQSFCETAQAGAELATQVPGTSATGPPPTSINDLTIGEIINRVLGLLQ